MSLPLSAVIEQLKSTPGSIIPILASLQKCKTQFSSVSKVDLKHLTSRTLNLCRSNDAYAIWCGVNVLHVLADTSEIVGSEGQAIFAQLLKILGSVHTRNKKVLTSTVECLARYCDNVRGKPTLTRELLTPSLSAIFAALLEKVAHSPLLVLKTLRKLIQEHPTTSRPFANKLKAHLLRFVLEEHFLSLPEALRAEACGTLACLPVIEKDGPDQHWQRDVEALIREVASTLDIYSSFLNVKEDQEASAALKTLAGPGENEGIFPPLNIDINHAKSMLSISQRVAMLLELLLGYINSATSYAVAVPLGKVLSLVDLVCGLNPRFIPFKREIRDIEVRHYIELSLSHCHLTALDFLTTIPRQFSASLVPHLSAVFATLELLVFLQGKRLDRTKILANELLMCQVITCTSAFLSLTSYYSDHSQLSRILDAAVFLVQPRSLGDSTTNEADKVRLSNQSKSARKKAKRNAAIPLSDLISHEHLFKKTVPETTRSAVFALFDRVIKCVPISSTHYNKILRFVLVEAVGQTDSTKYHSVSHALERILVSSVLHPAPESASILPIATRILPENVTLGVLNAPRFPPLPVLVKGSVDDDEEENDEDENEDEGEDEGEGEGDVDSARKRDVDYPAKRFKPDNNTTASDNPTTAISSLAKSAVEASRAKGEIFTSKPFKSLQENQQDIKQVKAEKEGLNEEAGQQNEAAIEINEVSEAVSEAVSEVVEEEMESDSGSEIEIPDLDLGDDSDEEK